MWVVVRMTLAEAKNLSHAIGNSLYSLEDADSLFTEKRDRDAAYRGQQKFDAAIQHPTTVPAGRCPTHPRITLRCPGCAGSKGGAVKSTKKARAARRNGLLALVSTPNAKETA